MSTRRWAVLIAALITVAVTGPLTVAVGRTSHARAAVPTVHSPTLAGIGLGLSGALSDLASGTPASLAIWDSRARHVSAQFVRVDVSWNSVAPVTRPPGFNAANPSSAGYDWSQVDSQVSDITRAGFRVLIQINGAPTWAEGPNIPASVTPGTWEPNAADLGQFATAIATRYGGRTPNPANPGTDLPTVRDWQAWNEPNLAMYLAPQWLKSGSHFIATSPGIYRRMENAFYASVTAVSSSNYVIGAGTAPYGDPPGGARMAPVVFDQTLFCLTTKDRAMKPCAGAVDMDAIDDHPYVSGLCCHGPLWHAERPADTSIPDMYKIVDVLKAAEHAGTIAPAGPKGVWATEIGWNTDPPNPYPDEASSPAQVGRWATQALYVLWSQGVNDVLWYQLSDAGEDPAGWDVTYTEGLYYLNGTAKPAAAALAFPFMTNRRTTTSVEAWGRSPASGMLVIQRKLAGSWTPMVQLRVKATQVFEAPLSLRNSGTFRAVVAGHVSPVWSQAA